MNFFDRTNVDASGRLIEQYKRSIHGHLATEDDLLLIAPGERTERRVDRTRRDVKTVTDIVGEDASFRSIEQPTAEPGKTRSEPVVGHRHVVDDRCRERAAFRLAFGRDVGQMTTTIKDGERS